MRKILPILVVGIFVLSGLGAVGQSVNNSETQKLEMIFSKPIITDEDEYVTIDLEDANSFLIEEGKPLLPMYTKKLTYPIGTKIKEVNVQILSTKKATISKDIVTSPVAVQIGQLKVAKPTTEELTQPYPEKWFDYKVSTNYFDKQVVVNLYINPVKYDPLDKTITWANKVNIIIDYEKPESNPVSNSDYDFLILTADQFSSALNPLIAHKSNLGISTKIVQLSQITSSTQGRDDAEKVKYYIKEEIEASGVKYVMLVGNEDEFPARETNIRVSSSDREVFVSDLYYADIYNGEGAFATWDTNQNDDFAEYGWTSVEDDEMDLHPDVAIGRIPANDINEVNTIVNKIMTYENQEAYTQDWFSRLVVVGGDSFVDEEHDEEGILEGEYVNQHVIDFMDGFIADKMWVSNGILGDLSPTGVRSISNAINQGCGFVDFSGHGNKKVYATHPHWNEEVWLPTPSKGYLNTDAGKLSNGNKLPIVVTGACSVSKYDETSSCFSYSWLQNSNGGAIASFGATALGYAYISSAVTHGLVEGMAIDTLKAYRQDGAITLGEMWVWGLERYMDGHQINDGGEYKTVTEWQMFGDPTLAIAAESQVPNKPDAPNGPTNGGIDVKYTYSATGTDPDGDRISFLFDWGDEKYSEWIGPVDSGDTVQASHTWTESNGDLQIRVATKDVHGKQSEWSDPLSVSMPKNKVTQFPVFAKILNQFPILQKVLERLF